MNKVCRTSTAAVAGLLRNDMTIAAGGFGLCGIPENLIQAIVESGVTGLTIVGNNAGVDDFGMGLLLKARQVKKVIASYVGENKEFERRCSRASSISQLTPQGTLAEKLRAGGAGIPGFYTRTAAGTPLAEARRRDRSAARVRARGKHSRRPVDRQGVEGRHRGNLVYRKTSRNFNPMIASCGNVTVAEVEQLVESASSIPMHPHAWDLRRPHRAGRKVREAD
jgi:3-oxoacid CoA-transferase